MRKITCINDHWKFQLSDGRQETVNRSYDKKRETIQKISVQFPFCVIY